MSKAGKFLSIVGASTKPSESLDESRLLVMMLKNATFWDIVSTSESKYLQVSVYGIPLAKFDLAGNLCEFNNESAVMISEELKRRLNNDKGSKILKIAEAKIKDIIGKDAASKLYYKVKGGEDSSEVITNLSKHDDLLVVHADLFNDYLKTYFEREDVEYYVFYPLILTSKAKAIKVLQKYRHALGDYKIERKDKGTYYLEYVTRALID